MTIFSEQEIKSRRSKILPALRRQDVAAAIIVSQDNIYYLTGMPVIDRWGRPEIALLRDDGTSALIVPAGERKNAEDNAFVDELLVFNDSRNVMVAAMELAIAVLRKWGADRRALSVEMLHLPHSLALQMVHELQPTEIADFNPIIEPIRIVKSEDETRLLRLGGDIAKAGMTALLKAAVVGSSEAEVAGKAEAAMYAAASPKLPSRVPFCCFTYCNSGPHTLTPHLRPTNRTLRKGEPIGLNVFPIVAGYLVELERTVILGHPSPAQEDIMRAIEEAFAEGKRSVRAGIRACDIDAITVGVRRQYGYGNYTRGGTGHSHGIMIGSAGREEPGELRAYNTEILRAGMVLSVEPGIYIPELGGFRHSDVVLVRDDAAETLTEFEAPLFV